MNPLCAKLPLHYDVSLLESRVHVAQTELKVAGHVGARGNGVFTPSHHPGAGRGNQRFVDDRGVLSHGVAGSHYGRQHLVLHVYQRQGLLSDVRAGGRYRCYRMSEVESLLSCQHVPDEEPVVGNPSLFLGRELGRDVNQVGCGRYGLDSRQLKGPATVDALDPGVGVRTPEYFPGQHTRKMDVGGIPGATGYLVPAIVAYGPGAHNVVLMGGQDYVGLVIQHISSIDRKCHSV